jgi:hypothetical protein
MIVYFLNDVKGSKGELLPVGFDHPKGKQAKEGAELRFHRITSRRTR